MFKEFKEFAMRGNVLDLAVGIVIGGAFGTIVKSLVDDVIMPPIGLAMGNVDFSDLFLMLKAGTKSAPPYATLAEAQGAGAVTINYGLFVNSIITFLIIAFAVFLIVRAANRLRNLQREIQEFYWDFRLTTDLLELRNLATAAALIVDCALRRKESRGLHYTLDYPESDDAKFGTNTVVQRV